MSFPMPKLPGVYNIVLFPFAEIATPAEGTVLKASRQRQALGR